jgi:hypothetical protein
MYGHASCSEVRMRVSGIVFLLLWVPLALADTANVAKASELLDFDIAGVPAVKGAGLAALDIDGDGQISKAEAAGNAEITGGFDRADRNRNGTVRVAAWERYEKWQERRAKEREARLARSKAKGSASAGGTAAKKPRGSAP